MSEGGPWLYIPIHTIDVMLTDTVIMSLTLGLRNAGSPWQYIAIHTMSVDRHYGDALAQLESSVWNEGSPWQYTAIHIMHVMLILSK